MFDKITKKNWLFYAIKNYNVPNLDTEQEFYEDVKRFKMGNVEKNPNIFEQLKN